MEGARQKKDALITEEFFRINFRNALRARKSCNSDEEDFLEQIKDGLGATLAEHNVLRDWINTYYFRVGFNPFLKPTI